MPALNVTLALVVVFIVMGSASAQCPSITITGPPGVTNPDDDVKFQVEVRPLDSRFSYRWSVSAGTMIKGQGTPEITIKTDVSMANTTFTATVEIGGLPESCQSKASESAPIADRRHIEPVDEWGGWLSNDDVRTRLDNFFADLSNNPAHVGLIVLRIPEKERRDVKNRRLRLIVDHVRWRKFDINRLWFSFETFSEPRTILWRFYPGNEDKFPCDRCKFIKGSDISKTRR